MGNVACVWCLKLRAKNREACCLMEGFLLSITAKMSSDKCWRVVFKEKEKVEKQSRVNSFRPKVPLRLR